MKSRKSHWMTGGFVLAAALFGPGLYDMARLAVRQQQLERDMRLLTAEEERLKAEQTRLASDPVYVEGLIRSTFKVAKPGEYVVPLDEGSR
jgi:cell division protein FtsB